MFAYRVGFPGWKLAARIGLPLRVRFFVELDDESRTFIARSDDFQPALCLLTEGRTVAALRTKVRECCETGLEEVLGTDRLNGLLRPEMVLVDSLP